jgi:isoquinoline 1-oxidoreductase
MDPSPKSAYRDETELPLFEPAAFSLAITRRSALGLLLTLTPIASGEEPDIPPARRGQRFVLRPDGTLLVLTGKVEMGQGPRTLLRQAAAEEACLPFEKTGILMCDTDLVPDDGGTWASLTVPTTVPPVRQALAALRVALIEAAAKKGGVAEAEVRLENGRVLAGAYSASYAELLGAIPPQSLTRSAPLTPPSEWKVLGASVKPSHGRAIVTGAFQYASDWSAADTGHGGAMLHARVVRPPAHTASLESVEAPPEVKLIRSGDLCAVVAATPQAAAVDLARVRAQWTPKQLTPAAELAAHFKKTAEPAVAQPNARYPPLIIQGDAAAAMQKAARVVRASYTLPYIAHMALEPRACLAIVENGRLRLWTGNQASFLTRRAVARALGVAETGVRLTNAALGGAFGSKQGAELEIEAARIASQCPGQVVRLAWTREEETERAYFRPAGLIEIAAGLDARNRIVAWEHHNYSAGPTGLPLPYSFSDYWLGFHRCTFPLRQGSYRSLAAVSNNFAREMHMEACAKEAGQDALAYRLAHIADARLREALERGAEKFGWGRSKSGNGVGYGLCCNLEKEGRLALFAEVEVRDAEVRFRRAVCAADFGAALNPDLLRNQIEGAICMGIGGALFEEIRYDATRVLNPRMSQYRLPRFRDIPDLEVILIDRREIPAAGAGEACITLTAPALASALQRATGKTLRSLPLQAALRA